jgi:cytochrome c oxidase subunit II
VIASLAGFDRMQSALDPAGPQATRIAHLWWLMFWVSVVVFVAVVAFMLYAVARVRATSGAVPPPDLVMPRLTRWWMTVGVGVSITLTVIVLFVLLGVSTLTSRALASLGRSDALSVTVTGHQWWWEIEYEDAVPVRRLTTANELHIPVGRPVLIKTASHDVIHSLWVPNLHGKRDLIPGQPASLWIEADRPGEFRGQCAEFCGLQHANMALLVVAEPAASFEAWLDAQRAPAALPRDELARRGQHVFESGPCALCHQVRGTIAGGRVAPDLTHLASRRTLAAGTLPNTPGALAGWMIDAQHVKPGDNMPSIGLANDELQALLAYLGGLS